MECGDFKNKQRIKTKQCARGWARISAQRDLERGLFDYVGWLKPSSTFTGSETNIDLNINGPTSITLTAQWSLTNYIKNFDYTGSVQTWSAPETGYYKLEVWGASGGGVSSSDRRPGYGGYAVGVLNTTKNITHYIYVGGQGAIVQNAGGGYNGGGSIRSATSNPGGGGGATHIATVSGLLKNLSSYKDTGGTNVSKEILIVAGGGGGNWNYSGLIGGDGGGTSGKAAVGNGNSGGKGGTQTAAGTSACRTQNNGAFGKGGSVGGDDGSAVTASWIECGGGGGWYGGSAGGNNTSACSASGGGGGGSGYIGSSNLISGGGITKHMTCYSCTTSTTAATRTNSNTNVSATATSDYSKTGNGYARITWLGDTI